MKVIAICACGKQKEVLEITLKRSEKKNGRYICMSCASKNAFKPQCTKYYWTKEKKNNHSNSIKNSKKYYDALKTRNAVNGMKGRKHSEESRKKMSLSRIGKIGENATAWKGGKNSINKRVRGLLKTRLFWYQNIYKRDNFNCTVCKSNKKLDAHHIIPLRLLIKTLLIICPFHTDDEKLEWLIKQPEISDLQLLNGKTLCRECHKRIHINWGSHEIR